MRRAAFLLFAAAAVAVGVSAARAQTPGGLYRGTHSNGGTVEMKLTADGKLDYFRASDLKLGGSCPPSIGIQIPGGFPITGGELDLIGSSLSVSATFPTPTTARGTFSLSCSTTTLSWTAKLSSGGTSTTPSSAPAPQGDTTAPYFLGGHESVKLERRAGVAYIRASFRTCHGMPPFKLVVRQRRSVSRTFVAESRFTLKLPAGTPLSDKFGTPCRDNSIAWRLAPRFFGGGLLVITLKVVDSGGRESLIPGFLVRSPKK